MFPRQERIKQRQKDKSKVESEGVEADEQRQKLPKISFQLN